MADVQIKMIDDNLAEVTIDGVTFKNVIVKNFPEEELSNTTLQDVSWFMTLTTSKTDEKCFELIFDEISINA